MTNKVIEIVTLRIPNDLSKPGKERKQEKFIADEMVKVCNKHGYEKFYKFNIEYYDA